jgi:REP element-mobilizing transposase RayT
MSRGVDGREIYVDADDRRRFVAELDRRASALGAEILAYCLMGNHFHLAVRVSRQPLCVLMQRLLTTYALEFNLRHKRTGHLFQARYRAIVCFSEAYLYNIIRYIHQNPVRAKLAAKPGDWPWSSAAKSPDPDGDLPVDFDPWEGADVGALIRAEVEEVKSLELISEDVARRVGVSTRLMRSPARLHWIKAVRVELLEAAISEGHSPAAVRRWLGTTASSISRYLAKIRPCSKGRRPSSPVPPAESA